MASQISLYLRMMMIDHSLLGVPAAAPGTLYLALYTNDPTYLDVGSEVSGGSYARRTIAFAATADMDVASNTTQLTFPTATASWGKVTHWGIRDALTLGNLYYFGQLDLARTVPSTTVLVVPVGSIKVDYSGDTV